MSERITVVPISGPLGIADITVELPSRADGDSVVPNVLLMRRDKPGTQLVVPMTPLEATPPGPGKQRDGLNKWTTRVMAGPSSGRANSPGDSMIEFGVRYTNAAGQTLRTSGPHRHSASPPADRITPDWAKGAVWYQIFPERFRNGNPQNDPRGPQIFRSRWSSRWADVTPDELEAAWARSRAGGEWYLPRVQGGTGRRRTGGAGGQLYNVVFDRRYGGDLQGITEKLDELADLGVTAIYLNPIFHAHSLHKYDASDYRHIDPTLGHPGRPSDAELRGDLGESADPRTWVWTPSDRYFLDVLLPEAHARGLRVILDGVWNHVGAEFWAFRDVVRNGEASPYAKWFDARFATAEQFPEWPTHQLDLRPGRLAAWKSWWSRNSNLPEFARAPGRERLHPEVESHIFDATKRWMDPNGDGDPSDGIDGWRLDVVPDVPMPFWEAWRQHCKAINPAAILFAEVWFDAGEYFGGKAFDGQMNYPFAVPVVRWLSNTTMTSVQLAERLTEAFANEPHNDLVQMNLVGSHDTDRIASGLFNPGRDYDQNASIASGARYDDTRPPAEVYDLVVLCTALQAVYAGSPMIYYGDEYGVFGADDPDCRKPLPWSELGPTDDPSEAADPALRARMRQWLRLRQDSSIGGVLRFGSVYPIAGPMPELFIVDRRLNNRLLRFIANRGSSACDVSSILGRGWESVGPNADDTAMLPARSGRLWLMTVGE